MDIKVHDSWILNFILSFKKSELLKIFDKLEQALLSTPYMKSLQINVISQRKIQNIT